MKRSQGESSDKIKSFLFTEQKINQPKKNSSICHNLPIPKMYPEVKVQN